MKIALASILTLVILVSGCAQQKVEVRENSVISVSYSSSYPFGGSSEKYELYENGTFSVFLTSKGADSVSYVKSAPKQDILNMAKSMVDAGFFDKTFSKTNELRDSTENKLIVSIDGRRKEVSWQGGAVTEQATLSEIVDIIRETFKVS